MVPVRSSLRALEQTTLAEDFDEERNASEETSFDGDAAVMVEMKTT